MKTNGNNSREENVVVRMLRIEKDFVAFQANCQKRDTKNTSLLRAIQQELVKFEARFAENMVGLRRDVDSVLELLTRPKKKSGASK